MEDIPLSRKVSELKKSRETDKALQELKDFRIIFEKTSKSSGVELNFLYESYTPIRSQVEPYAKSSFTQIGQQAKPYIPIRFEGI